MILLLMSIRVCMMLDEGVEIIWGDGEFLDVLVLWFTGESGGRGRASS